MSNREYTVYKHTTPDGKSYIGMTSRKLYRRYGHGHGYVKNKRLNDAIKKFGWEAIDHEIIGTGLTQENAIKLEQETIKRLDTTNPDKGYNISIGGLGGTLGVKLGEETRKKMSESRKGEKNPRYGIKFPKELSEKLSQIRHGRCSEKQLANLRKMQEKAKKKVICLDTHEVFNSVAEAAKHVGVCSSGISNTCKGEYFKSGGYHWAYYNGQDEIEIENMLKEVIYKETHVVRNFENAIKANSKPVICIETGEVFPSSKKASERYGVNNSSINNVLGNPNRKSCGFHWDYYKG